MRRYVETFFRYWMIALVPIIVLPVAGYALVHVSPKTVLTSANIWVDPSVAGSTSSQYSSPAQSEAATLSQLLQSPSFDLSVAHSSPIYTAVLAKVKDLNPAGAVARDLLKNVQIVAKGDQLVTVSYASNNWRLGEQVVSGLLGTARNWVQVLYQQQLKASITFYTNQVTSDRQSLASSSKAFSDYVRAHNISAGALLTREVDDPALAGLAQQMQSDQSDLQTAQKQLSKLRTNSQLPASMTQQGSFRVMDPPTAGPDASVKKQEQLDLGIAALIGLLLCAGLVVVKTVGDHSLRYADEVPELLALPVLAVVPYSRTFAAPGINTPPTRGNVVPRSRLADAEQVQ